MRPSVYIPKRPADESASFPRDRGFLRPGRLSRPKALPAHLAALLRRPTRSTADLLPFNDPRVDACLGGGLPLGQLHEIGTSGVDAETAALPTGFIAALLARIAPARPVFWIAPVSDLHPPGLLPYSLDPNRLMLVHPAKDVDTLAAMEVALREGVAVAVGVSVGDEVIVGVTVGVGVFVRVLVGVAVQRDNGQGVGVHVGVKVHVGGMVAVSEGVKVIVGVTGFITRPIRLNEPSAINKIRKPKPPMMANFNQFGI